MSSLWNYFATVPAAPKKTASFWRAFESADPPETGIRQAPQSAPSAVYFQEDHLFWAMRNLPIREATKHFLIAGAIGSGKTTAIKLFLQSIAPRFQMGRGKPEQLIVFDAKGDLIPYLAALGHPPEAENVWIINPYDARSAVWNVAEAVQRPMMARHLAALLVPEEKNSNAPYFWTASRQLVYATILGLNSVAGPKWDFRDLLCALESRDHIKAVTARHPRAQRVAEAVLKDGQHSDGVISSLATKLGPFEQIAALWHSAPAARQFSIKNFLGMPGVLILGNDPVLRESLWPINAILLKALSQEILRGPEVLEPAHWFVLDEFTAMEKVSCVHELVNRGRSKGASVMIGLQGIDKLNELYQETGANDLLEQLAQKTFLRAGGPKTAEWIERFFGKYRRTEPTYSESWNHRGEHSASIQYQVVERSTFTASTFMNLPFTGPGRPYIAVSDIPSEGISLITRRWYDTIDSWIAKPLRIPSVIPRDSVREQNLEPWDTFEEASFCGDAAEKPEEPKKKKKNLPKR